LITCVGDLTDDVAVIWILSTLRMFIFFIVAFSSLL
jgi:hypothetical protein